MDHAYFAGRFEFTRVLHDRDIAEHRRLGDIDSPNKSKYFLDDISEDSSTDGLTNEEVQLHLVATSALFKDSGLKRSSDNTGEESGDESSQQFFLIVSNDKVGKRESSCAHLFKPLDLLTCDQESTANLESDTDSDTEVDMVTDQPVRKRPRRTHDDDDDDDDVEDMDVGLVNGEEGATNSDIDTNIPVDDANQQVSDDTDEVDRNVEQDATDDNDEDDDDVEGMDVGLLNGEEGATDSDFDTNIPVDDANQQVSDDTDELYRNVEQDATDDNDEDDDDDDVEDMDVGLVNGEEGATDSDIDTNIPVDDANQQVSDDTDEVDRNVEQDATDDNDEDDDDVEDMDVGLVNGEEGVTNNDFDEDMDVGLGNGVEGAINNDFDTIIPVNDASQQMSDDTDELDRHVEQDATDDDVEDAGQSVPECIHDQEQGTMPDHDAFQKHFEGKTAVMRQLLIMYTVKTNVDDVLNLPQYQQEVMGVVDDQIADHFFRTFSHESFFLEKNFYRPRHESVKYVTDVLEPSAVETHSAMIKLRDKNKILQGRLNAAKSAKTKLVQFGAPMQDQVLRNIYTHLRKKVRDLTADGGDTNGEMRRASIEKIMNVLISKHSFSADDVILDGGANYNIAIMHICQVVGCRGIGVEYIITRVLVAANGFLNTLKAEAGLLNPKVAYIPVDLYLLRHYGNVTVAFFNDEAFPTPLVLHEATVCAMTRSVRLILSTRAGKKPTETNQIFKSCGFECVSRVENLHKTVSGESNTLYIYQRTSAANDVIPAWQGDKAPANILSLEEMNTKYLKIAWGDCTEARKDLYTTILNEAHASLTRLKQGRSVRKTRGVQGPCLASVWIQCGGDCPICADVFKHETNLVRCATSLIQGDGLFAIKHIPSGSFLIEYVGKLLTELPKTMKSCKYILKLEESKYIDARASTGVHKYVNHCCSPNARLVRWQCTDGTVHLSIKSVCKIVTGNEVTIDYGNDDFTKCHFDSCLCPTCSTTEPPKILVLGMMYCPVVGDVENLVASVERKDTLVMDGRDTIRCMAMEEGNQAEVYSLDIRGPGRTDRHIISSFQDRKMIAHVRDFMESKKDMFSQIILDYFNSPNGWTDTHWGDKLFSYHLQGFGSLLHTGGCVFFPFTEHCLQMLSKHSDHWSSLYKASFINKTIKEEMNQNLLWKATSSICPDRMEKVFEKKRNQESVYCVVSSTSVGGMLRRSSLHDDRSEIRALLVSASAEELENFRFIRLELKENVVQAS
jgi:hypothetical protein